MGRRLVISYCCSPIYIYIVISTDILILIEVDSVLASGIREIGLLFYFLQHFGDLVTRWAIHLQWQEVRVVKWELGEGRWIR